MWDAFAVLFITGSIILIKRNDFNLCSMGLSTMCVYVCMHVIYFTTVSALCVQRGACFMASIIMLYGRLGGFSGRFINVRAFICLLIKIRGNFSYGIMCCL